MKKVITKRIQSRNANILKYHLAHYSNRQIGRIMHLSHTQIANIIRKLEKQEIKEVNEIERI